MSGAQAAWLAATITATGLLLLALSRAFTVEKLGAFGLEFRLSQPIEHSGIPRLKGPGAFVFLAGLALGIHAGWLTTHPPVWPSRFSDLDTAELAVSAVDDLMIVSVNNKEIARVAYGQTPEPFDVKKELHRGANKIEIIIQNGDYGGCGAALTLRLNDQENPEFKWRWSEQKNMPAKVICFSQTQTLNLR
jgi:hypothetical protein